MNRLSIFKGLSCFEIAHHECCKDVFVDIEIKGQKHTRSLRKHPTHEEISNLHSELKQKEDVPVSVTRRDRPQSEQDSVNTTSPDACEAPLDVIDVNAAESISVLNNIPS